MARKYGVEFRCDFDLMLYPFDRQLCFIDLKLNKKILQFVEFDQQDSTVEYIGKNRGLEYDVS